MYMPTFSELQRKLIEESPEKLSVRDKRTDRRSGGVTVQRTEI